MILYHGTDSISADRILSEGILLDIGSKYVDNGQGFYTATDKKFALERAKMVVENRTYFDFKNLIEPVVLSFELDNSAFSNSDLNIKIFEDVSSEWKEFVLLNRLGKKFLCDNNIKSENHNLDFKFDIVYNNTADAGITAVVSNIKKQKVNYLDCLHSIDISDKKVWGKQISFHTEKGLKYLNLIK